MVQSQLLPDANALPSAPRDLPLRGHDLDCLRTQDPTLTSGPDWAARALRTLGLQSLLAPGDLLQIPVQGPAVFVCNSPLGGAEPLILASLIEPVRDDMRLLLDADAAPLEPLRRIAFLVERDPTPGVLRDVLAWLRGGHCLVTFPAGRVSHRGPLWSSLAARLALHTRADLVPVLLYETEPETNAGVDGAATRTVAVRIGRRIAARRMRHLDRDQLTSHLQLRTMLLAGRNAGEAAVVAPRPAPPARRQATIVAPEPVEVLERELAALPDDRCLMESGSIRVYYAAADEIPHLLREIGRLREQTFRLVGEGTGREIDLDRYDPHYEHLFSWDGAARQMIGAYRLGRTDQILATQGLDGLYTQSLFQLDPDLFKALGPALEMGRSFIIPAHQKDFSALYTLWCGIGRYVVRHPRHQKLFGAVSISNEYASLSRQLLMEFLRINELDTELTRLVTPRNPPKWRPVPRDTADLLSAGVRRIEDVEELVRELESDRRGVPILLRQYLRLNGSLLAFNIDPDFGDVLDGLMLVDVTRIEPKMFRRFLGLPGPDALRALAER